jgi:hypothetical protein
MLYAGLQVVHTFADLVFTTVCNLWLPSRAAELMRRGLRSERCDSECVEEIIEHCLRDDDCMKDLGPEAQAVVGKAFTEAAELVSKIPVAGYLALAALIWYMFSGVEFEDTEEP